MDSRISARSLAAALGGWRSKDPVYEALADGIRLLCLDNRRPRVRLSRLNGSSRQNSG